MDKRNFDEVKARVLDTFMAADMRETMNEFNDVLDMSRIESGSVKLEEDNRQKAFACGMNEHIIKPIAIETIARVLDEIFQEKGKGHITVD